MKKTYYFLSSIIFFAFSPIHVFAHGFGERIDLPIPLNLYLIGAGAAVIVSFLLIGFIRHKGDHLDSYPRYNLLNIPWIRNLSENQIFLGFIKIFFVFLFFLIVIAGFIGKQSSAFNILPTVVWIIFGVGMTYVSSFIGNIWSLINPLKTLFGWLERLSPGLSLDNVWPRALGVWPAFAFFFVYRWIENIYPESADPSTLSLFIVLYTLITFSGMIYFGKVNWLRFGDPFSVFFRFLSYFSITEARTVNERKELNIRPPAVGLFKDKEVGVSQMIFVLFMLSSVAFDGVLATPVWLGVKTFLFNLGLSSLMVGTLGLVLLLGVFTVVYLAFSQLVRFFSRSTKNIYELAYTFVFALLPIAIAYEVAHFISLLFIEGQRIVYLISNPFGLGWDIFGTAAYKINFGVINLKTLWNWQVGLIIFGHIAAVYVAHIIALHLFQDRKKATRSQYPMLVLMVFYTIFSLWIIAQPIVLGA